MKGFFRSFHRPRAVDGNDDTEAQTVPEERTGDGLPPILTPPSDEQSSGSKRKAETECSTIPQKVLRLS